jgi:hypothetical protein
VAEVVEPQSAGLAPRYVLHGLGLRPQPLPLLVAGCVRPLCLVPAVDRDDRAKQSGRTSDGRQIRERNGARRSGAPISLAKIGALLGRRRVARRR